MGLSFFESSALARDLFVRASDVLRFDLASLCFTGPEAELRRTENAQPALLTVGTVASALLRAKGVEPMAVAGHSVGEFAALVAADALTFEDGIRLVRTRGELMAQMGDRSPGTMAAIVGVSLETVADLCAESSTHGAVEIANENGPAQTVIAGERAAVEHVIDLVEARNEGAGVLLNVSAAFHSRLMAPIVEQMADVLRATPIRAARIPVIANVTGDAVRAPDAIFDALVRQIAGRVRWSTCVRQLALMGAQRLIEVGFGRTLTRLARTIVPTLALEAAEDLLATPTVSSSRG
jgi:[acyl-carrier-protein] S-malonyltransferase